MTPTALAALCAAAFTAGVVDAIAGGGGLITLPALLVAGLPLGSAIATNKGQSTFGTAAALTRFVRAGAVDGPRAKVAFPCGLAGALAGAAAVLAVPPAALRPVVLALLVAVALVLALRRNLGVGPPGPPPATRVAQGRAGVIAVILGFYDGFFGPGVGTFLIMALVAWLRDPMARATANAKVVNFASNLAALCLFAARGAVLWRIALPMAAAQALGGAVGAGLAVKRGDRFVRGVVLAVVAALVAKLAHDVATGR